MRAKLDPEEVTRIILMATMTEPGVEVTKATELEKRKAEGFLDTGWHWLVQPKGNAHRGVPDTERGSLLPRYARDSIVICVVGGMKDGQPANTFTELQFLNLKELIEETQRAYPNAKPTLYRELFKGVNPVFNHEDYQ